MFVDVFRQVRKAARRFVPQEPQHMNILYGKIWQQVGEFADGVAPEDDAVTLVVKETVEDGFYLEVFMSRVMRGTYRIRWSAGASASACM